MVISETNENTVSSKILYYYTKTYLSTVQ